MWRVTVILLVLIVCDETQAAGFFIGKSGNGLVIPVDPYIYIGQELVLTCNLTKALPEDSSHMYLTKDNNIIPAKYVRILSTRTIQLRLPITSMHDEGNYVCKLNRTQGSVEIIDSQYVKVEYELQRVDKINCKVRNWEEMKCFWDLGVHYIHEEDINVELVWTTEGDQYDCPKLTQKRSCTWRMGSKTGEDTFFSGMKYLMKLSVQNKVTGDEVSSSIITVYTSRIVEPARVSNLQLNPTNSTCLQATWSHSQPLEEKVYRVRYNSEWEPHVWKESELTELEHCNLCNLLPNTHYRVEVTCKPVIKGYWSKPTIQSALTKEDVPGAAPALSPGGFSESPCDTPDCRIVTLYWQKIPPKIANGRIRHYIITETAQATGKSKDHFFDNTSKGSLVLADSKSYVLEVRGSTSAGTSHHFSSIRIPSQTDRPAYPDNFVVDIVDKSSNDRNTRLIRLRWSRPDILSKDKKERVESYTVYWCKNAVRPEQCRNNLQWTSLGPESRELYMNASADISLFGISMETMIPSNEITSSGIKWNLCIYKQNAVPQRPPKNFRILPLDSNGELQVDWDHFKCHESLSNILAYTVFYCEAEPEGNCTSPAKKIRVEGHHKTVTISHLQTDTSYSIWMVAEAESGFGPTTKMLYTTIDLPGGLTNEHIIGIAIGVFIVCLLALFSIVIFIRHCVRTVKENFKPYDIVMPHVPLPPIPMPDPSPVHTPDSLSSDGIYERIDGKNGHGSNLSSPDTSIERPLIGSNYGNNNNGDSGTLSKCQLYGDGQHVYIMKNNTGNRVSSDSGRGSMKSAQVGTDSGRGSMKSARVGTYSGRGTMKSAAESFLSRLNPLRSSTTDSKRIDQTLHRINGPLYDINGGESPIIAQNRHVPYKAYITSSLKSDYPYYKGSHFTPPSVKSDCSYYKGDHFTPPSVRSQCPCYIGDHFIRPTTSSQDDLDCSASGPTKEPSPYSCVDILNPPMVGLFPKGLRDMECQSVGSTYSDPAYGTNNLSVTPNKKQFVPAKSADDILQQNFNIKMNYIDKVNPPQDYHYLSRQDKGDNSSSLSREATPVTASSEQSVFLPPYVTPYVQIADTAAGDDDLCSLEENTCMSAEIPHPLNLKTVSTDGYVKQEQVMCGGHINPLESMSTSPKQLNIKGGPRPISQVINVPAHFYGSLSLLEPGDATEL